MHTDDLNKKPLPSLILFISDWPAFSEQVRLILAAVKVCWLLVYHLLVLNFLMTAKELIIIAACQAIRSGTVPYSVGTLVSC